MALNEALYKPVLLVMVVPMLLLGLSFGAVDQPGSPEEWGGPGVSQTRAAPAPYTEWSSFRGGPAHTGNASCIGPSSGPTLWESEQSSDMFSSPSVKYGKVYIGRDESVYCYDAYSGDVVWSHNLSEYTHSSPLVFGGRVYIGGSSLLFCLDANGTGDGNTTRYWSAAIGGTVDSSPSTNGEDMIYIASGKAELRAVYTNGTPAWNSSINGGSACSPAYSGNRVYVGGGGWTGGDYGIYCFDSRTGALVWSRQLDSPVCSSPAIEYGNVYVAGSGDIGGTGEFGNLYCLDAEGNGDLTTDIIWSYDIRGSYSSPSVGYNRVYIGSNGNTFYCLDAFGYPNGSTELYWSKGFSEWSHSSSIITSEYVYTGSGDGWFHCLNRTTGATVWSRTIGRKGGPWGVSSSPALANNLIYITNEGKSLFCIGGIKETLPPKVLSNYPAADEEDVPVDASVKLVLNKAVVRSTITHSSFGLWDPEGVSIASKLIINAGADTALLIPDEHLKNGEEYTVVASTDITDHLGYHLDGDRDGKDEGIGLDDHRFSFTTVPLYQPKIDPIPVQRPLEDTLHKLNLTGYITDPDTALDALTVEEDSEHITVEGLVLNMRYPAGFDSETVNLSVSDGDHISPVLAEFLVEVVPVDHPPVNNNFTFEMDGGLVTFTANPATYGGDGDLKYSWDFGDGETGAGLTVRHSYKRGEDIREYIVTLSVSDGLSGFDDAERKITIPADPGGPGADDDDDDPPEPGDDDIGPGVDDDVFPSVDDDDGTMDPTLTDGTNTADEADRSDPAGFYILAGIGCAIVALMAGSYVVLMLKKERGGDTGSGEGEENIEVALSGTRKKNKDRKRPAKSKNGRKQ